MLQQAAIAQERPAEPTRPSAKIPDLTALSLRAAFDRVHRLGLKLRAWDRWGNRVRRGQVAGYVVLRQVNAVGHAAEPGDVVRVKVRKRRRLAAMGY